MKEFGLSYREVMNEPIDGFGRIIRIMELDKKEEVKRQKQEQLKQKNGRS